MMGTLRTGTNMHRWTGLRGRSSLVVGVWLLVPSCQEPNPDFDGPASTSTSTSSSEGVPPEGSTTAGADGTTSLEPSTTTEAVSPDSSSGTTGEVSSSSSSITGGDEPLYPPCMLDEDPACPRPYDECYDFLEPDYTVCTLPCRQDDECPVPASGDAQPQCAGQTNDQCVLDCSGGATCPDGMECQQVGPGGMFERCLWPS
jgi:hypothetical protein